MKDEDLDWGVYHLLIEDPCQNKEALANRIGCRTEEIEQSLGRLEQSMLISQETGGCRVLSVQEMFLKCQSRYDLQSTITFEGGVIRLKKGHE